LKKLAYKTLKLLGVLLWDLCKLTLCNLKNQASKILSFERFLECAKFIEDDTKGSDVRFVRVGFLTADFRAHIIRCSYVSYSLVICVFEYFADSKITNLDSSVLSEENIRGFDISMEYLPIMNEFKRNYYLNKSI